MLNVSQCPGKGDRRESIYFGRGFNQDRAFSGGSIVSQSERSIRKLAGRILSGIQEGDQCH